MTDDDVGFVLDNINRRLALPAPLTRDDVIATRCGVRPLAVTASGGEQRDFLQLSRRHAIETDEPRRHISIFGGKLTDCLNVGEEIVAAVARLGITPPAPDARWYGEPDEGVRRAFLLEAERMGLDALTPPDACEPLTVRLWRRYGRHAFELLARIEEDPRQGELLIEGTEYLRGELELARRREMIVRLEDFLRRRAKISLVVGREALRHSAGLREACEILFGDRAEERLAEYFAEAAADDGASRADPALVEAAAAGRGRRDG